MVESGIDSLMPVSDEPDRWPFVVTYTAEELSDRGAPGAIPAGK
jgi:hypothetical protein